MTKFTFFSILTFHFSHSINNSPCSLFSQDVPSSPIVVFQSSSFYFNISVLYSSNAFLYFGKNLINYIFLSFQQSFHHKTANH